MLDAPTRETPSKPENTKAPSVNPGLRRQVGTLVWNEAIVSQFFGTVQVLALEPAERLRELTKLRLRPHRVA